MLVEHSRDLGSRIHLDIRRIGLCALLVAASACGGAAQPPALSLPPAEDPTATLDVPVGPVLFDADALILPAEQFPLEGFSLGKDEPIGERAWERQFTSTTSPDFHWFTVRLYVLEPDVAATAFVEDNGCDTIQWPDEAPDVREVDGSRTGDASRSCRYEFLDGQRVLYQMTGFRNVGIMVGAQPRRDRMTDAFALDWLAALARHQIALIGKLLMTDPPPRIPLGG